MKKFLVYLMFVSGVIFGVSCSCFLFLSGRDAVTKMKNFKGRVSEKINSRWQ